MLLILDEPTNHLDLDAIAWLEERLAAHRGGLVLVTHDRHVLDRVTTRILELDRGRGYVHERRLRGLPRGAGRAGGAGRRAETVRRNLARTELAWLRRGAPARTRKPKARIAAATALVDRAGPRRPPARGELDLALHADTPRLGDKVVELARCRPPLRRRRRGCSEAWTSLLDRRERLGIVGPNGAGKSTLLDVLAGRLAAGRGQRSRRGADRPARLLRPARPDLDPTQRVREAVAGPSRRPDWQDARLLERFWFDADAQWAPIGLLSGGERRRLQLLLVLAEQAQRAAARRADQRPRPRHAAGRSRTSSTTGPARSSSVSHDRAFLERTVADVVVIDGEHAVERVPGGYAAWEAERRATRTAGTTRRAATSTDDRRRSPASRPPPGSRSGEPTRPRSGATVRHLLRDAEKRLRSLERRRTELGAELSVAGADRERLASVGTELAEVEAELVAVEEEWLILSEDQPS